MVPLVRKLQLAIKKYVSRDIVVFDWPLIVIQLLRQCLKVTEPFPLTFLLFTFRLLLTF